MCSKWARMSWRACPLLVGEVAERHVLLGPHLVLLAGGVDAVLALQLLGDGLLQQPAALRHDRAELVADRLVHRLRSLHHDLDAFAEQLEQVVLQPGHRLPDLILVSSGPAKNSATRTRLQRRSRAA